MKFLRIGIALILIISSPNLFAQGEALLVLDSRNITQLPRHFRTTSDTPTQPHTNTTGLSDLHLIGSGEFSKLELEKVMQHLQLRKLTIIDLREESHGLLNGNAISWYGPQNASNAGKSPQAVEKIQAELLDNLQEMPDVVAYTILKKNAAGEIESSKPNEFAVHKAMSEEELAAKLHVNYERIYVQDMHAPRPDQVDHFLQVLKNLPADEWLYFHCRAGIGRTTTFMAMVDMLHNAKQVSFNEILARQVAIGGKSLTKLPKPDSFKYKPAVERLEFLKIFYQYARENTDLRWSEWLKQHN